MKDSVTGILAEKYGISTEPGGRVECPFCGHRTMSVKKDDGIAKCFHPGCGRYITPAEGDPSHSQSIHKALEKIHEDCHRALLAQADEKNTPNAYTYTRDVRLIHEQVIADAPIGAVPPNYCVSGAFDPVIREVETRLQEVSSTQGPGRPSKKETDKKRRLEEKLEFLVERKKALQALVDRRAGWITFHYADAHYRWTSIRFRNPFEKDKKYAFVSFTTGKSFGLFGHQMFSPGA